MILGIGVDKWLEILTGPACALIIALVFAYAFYQVFILLLNRDNSRFERIINIFEGEVVACERRYKQVFDELLKIRNSRH